MILHGKAGNFQFWEWFSYISDFGITFLALLGLPDLLITDIKMYFKLTDDGVKNILPEMQNKLKRIVESHMYKDNCTKKRLNF